MVSTMHSWHWLLWLVVTTASVWIVAGLLAVLHLTKRPRVLFSRPPAVSVLKPLCGADPGLRQNLESFFRQDHPTFELVFGVMSDRDPALAVVHELLVKHPGVACRVIVHAGQGALNPKVDNLLGILPAATHDLVLVSDSNVRAPSHYLRELASLYARERPGLVTNLFAGVGETSIGAALENVQLSGFCAAGVALPTVLGDPMLVGKSALFSRRRLARLGGLTRLSDVLAEDFVMGKTFAHAGARVLVAPTVLENVTGSMSVSAMLARQLRWAMMRARLRPLTALLEPLVSPLALLPVAWALLGPWSLAWAAVLLALRDLGGWLTLRGTARWYLPLLLAPLRELLVLAVWCVAPFKQHVSWRGKRFRLGAGTLLYLESAHSSMSRLSSTPAPAITRS
jgi:ceramide glucosyltransferase